MPSHQGLERPGVARRAETVQELRVGKARDGPLGEQAVDLPQGGTHRVDGHVSESPSSRGFTVNESPTPIDRQVFSAAKRIGGPSAGRSAPRT